MRATSIACRCSSVIRTQSRIQPTINRSINQTFTRSLWGFGKKTQPEPEPVKPVSPPQPSPVEEMTSSLETTHQPTQSIDQSNTVSVPLAPFFESHALRPTSVSKHLKIQITPTKLADICRMVSGLSCYEAINQMKLSPKKKGAFVANAILAAQKSGVNNFQMDASRMYVAEAITGRGPHYKRPDYKGRGRTGMKRVYFSHLKIVLREQPTMLKDRLPGMNGGLTSATMGRSHKNGIEIRVGRMGQKTHTQARQATLIEQYAEQKRRLGQKVPLQVQRKQAVCLRPTL